MRTTSRLFVGALAWLAMGTALAQDRTMNFNLPAQPLASALKDLSQQADLQMFYTAEAVQGKTAPALSGTYTARQAMEKLLAGTGVEYTFTAENAVALKLAENEEPTQEESDRPVTLPEMTVTGRAGSLTASSIEEAREELARIPGGTTLIEAERAREGAVYDVTDALSYAPGIYLGTGQGLAGGEARISIRGSDINSPISPILG
ncbi:MAG: secretin and TonB N-terminal domain-containing protein [Gammaproteobacteria bacterium]